jgi:hypothetical protein
VSLKEVKAVMMQTELTAQLQPLAVTVMDFIFDRQGSPRTAKEFNVSV